MLKLLRLWGCFGGAFALRLPYFQAHLQQSSNPHAHHYARVQSRLCIQGTLQLQLTCVRVELEAVLSAGMPLASVNSSPSRSVGSDDTSTWILCA